MLLSEFPQALDINPFPRKVVCNTCKVMHMSGGILNADENVVDEDEYGSTGLFKKRPLLLYMKTPT